MHDDLDSRLQRIEEKLDAQAKAISLLQKHWVTYIAVATIAAFILAVILFLVTYFIS